MKTQINLGDKIETWCCGAKVTGKVIEILQNGSFKVEHKPVKWGFEIYTQTLVKRSTPLQAIYYSKTTPGASKNGVSINI